MPCGCARCSGCTFKLQKNRVVCARCRDQRCTCKVCGQFRPKHNRIGDPDYVPLCPCSIPTPRKKKMTIRLQELLHEKAAEEEKLNVALILVYLCGATEE